MKQADIFCTSTQLVHSQHTPNSVFIGYEAESRVELPGAARTSISGVALFHFDDRLNSLLPRCLFPHHGFTPGEAALDSHLVVPFHVVSKYFQSVCEQLVFHGP